MQRCRTFVPVVPVNATLDSTYGTTYSGNIDGCKFMPENLAVLRILGGIRSPNETAMTKLIFEGWSLKYLGGLEC